MSSAAEVKNRLRPFGITFEKSLNDLIKGIRLYKNQDEKLRFIENAVNECRQEVKSANMELKTTAVLKLCYLQMYGYDMSFANFQVLEVMSSFKIQKKRIGYLSCYQSFQHDEDILILITNLLKKDLGSSSSLDVSLALGAVANIVNENLAKSIFDDIIKLLNHSKPYIRKKAVSALFNVYLKYPEGLKLSFDRLVDKLNDDDISVVSATITIICELSKKNPKIFVSLGPTLFDFLLTINNNWVIIRLLKIFAIIGKFNTNNGYHDFNLKLIPKILEILSSSNSMSIIYECINCLVNGELLNIELSHTCVDKLLPFINNLDPNLKFVGLLTLNRLIKFNSELHLESDTIIECLTHEDSSIKEQSLNLLDYIINEDNYELIVNILLRLLGKNDLLINLILNKIIDISTINNYENVNDFDFLIEVFVQLVKICKEYQINEMGYKLGIEFRNLLVKVPSLRSSIINENLIPLILDKSLITKLLSFYPAVIWCIGEYSKEITKLNNPEYDKLINQLIELFNSATVITNDEYFSLAKLYLLTTLVKILANQSIQILESNAYTWETMRPFYLKNLDLIISFLEIQSKLENFNIQDRAIQFLELLKIVKEACISQSPTEICTLPIMVTEILPMLFNSYELKPIKKNAQENIPVPKELDLDTEIYPIDKIYESIEDSYLNFRNPKLISNNNEIDSNNLELLGYLNDYQNKYEDSDDVSDDDDEDDMFDYNYDYNESSNYKDEPDKSIALIRPEDQTSLISKNDVDSNKEDLGIFYLTEKPDLSKKKDEKKKKKKIKPIILDEEFSQDEQPTSNENNFGKKPNKKEKKGLLSVESNFENLDFEGNSANSDNSHYHVGQDFEEYNIGNEPTAATKKVKSKKKSKKKSASSGSTVPKSKSEGVVEVKRKKKSKKKLVELD